ncbi:aspartate/glutamate racemase family protein, partial [Candidatus Bipolaricaulota bacterium]|nr:aspartate/glutamate racemase family protein [Candidatus Bipolaricaulota bacterium]
VGIEVIVPDPGEREEIHRIIYQELARGLIREDSRARVIGIAEKLIRKGAQGIILGCTELPLLIPKDSLDVAVLNTAEIHALAALEAALGD